MQPHLLILAQYIAFSQKLQTFVIVVKTADNHYYYPNEKGYTRMSDEQFVRFNSEGILMDI